MSTWQDEQWDRDYREALRELCTVDEYALLFPPPRRENLGVSIRFADQLQQTEERPWANPGDTSREPPGPGSFAYYRTRGELAIQQRRVRAVEIQAMMAQRSDR